MYHPYYRGKQYELIAIRETAAICGRAGFTPIVEPVRRSLLSLERAVEALEQEGGRCVVVVNPMHGIWSTSPSDLITELREWPIRHSGCSFAIVASGRTSRDDLVGLSDQLSSFGDLVLVHYGYTEPSQLAELVEAGKLPVRQHVFIESEASRLYRRQFEGLESVLVRDGFEKKNNRDYEKEEHFSDLHETYRQDGVSGFGDFSIVGDYYSETGGPAYAVAIHITFIDARRFNDMFVYHFKSDRDASPTDPAGKFYEALAKLVREVSSGESPVLRTNAIEEFFDLYDRRHYPGLGYVKKLSMMHHVETLATSMRDTS